MAQLLLAPAVLLVCLATLAWSLPRFPLEERQLGAPPLNDFLNVSRPANMTEYDPDTWTLGTRTLVQNAWQVQPYVANGYHGSRLTAEGQGYWVCDSCFPGGRTRDRLGPVVGGLPELR